jgi:WD40 repeat protein
MTMKALRFSLLLLCFGSILLSSCNSNLSSTSSESMLTATQTDALSTAPASTLEPIFTRTPTHIPTDTSVTSLPSNEPGLIVTLGEEVHSPWYPGIPVFSPDGQIVALASSRIRFWNVNTHQLIRELENPFPTGCYLSNALFSPDGKYFAVSISGCWETNSGSGHLLIWNISTGELIQEWTQECAKMPPTSTTSWDYIIPVSAMAFLPNSTTLVYASGNSLVIRDILKNDEHDVLPLSSKMYASQISLSSDGRLVYIIMSWMKDHDFPALWTFQHKFQVWNIYTHAMLKEVKYPQGWTNLSLELIGTSLVQVDFEKGTSQILNLQTDEIRDLPFRKGWRYYNSDGSLMVYARLFGFDENEQAIELWNTDNWRNIYTFMPDFGTDWTYGMHNIVFSPDNKILAIEHQEQITLWNIGPVVQP